MALTKLTTDLIDGSLGTDWQATPKTADFTAISKEGYFVNTTSTAITVTLPSSPTAGDEISLVDYGANAAANNITITSSDNIEGASDDLVLSTDKVSKTLVYSDATKGWLIATDAGAEAAAIPLTVDYLIVAGGGGGGGNEGAGGGAGGLRTSYGSTTGGGGSAEASLSLSASTDYTLTIGSGGNGNDYSPWTKGYNGSNSVFSTITSSGGGGGGSGITGLKTGNDGGSGGGESRGFATATGQAVTTPVVQGYRGGFSDPTNGDSSGGGGGAGGAGVDRTGNTTGGTNGGVGLAVNILSASNATTASIGEVSGSNIYFAGGGGGGSYGSVTVGAGGLGGGADGENTGVGFNATGNTGGGGGGGGGSNGDSTRVGGNGGSGVVILRYSDTYTITVGSGITEATGSPFTEGSDKVSVFTGGTGTISFS
jgi:hypothetical protein